MRKPKKAIVLTLLVAFGLMSASIASAFFFVTFDPTNYGNAVIRLAQLRMQLAQLQSTYNQITNQYRLSVEMARNIPNMATRYAATWAPWRFASAPDLYGNTSTWIDGANSGAVATVTRGYQKATNTLERYTSRVLADMPPTEKERVQSDSATVELTDGAAQNAIETVGAIRANAVATTRTINNIQNDSLSNSSTLNTEVSVLNKVNATSVLALQNAQDTKKLLVALLEQQTVLAKQARDAQTDAITRDIDRRANAVPMNNQFTGRFGETLARYRLP